MTEETGTGSDRDGDTGGHSPAEALTVAEPGLIAATNPLGATDAIAASDVAQFTTRFERIWPAESVSVAVNCSGSHQQQGMKSRVQRVFGRARRIATAATAAGVRIAYVLKCDTCAVTTLAECLPLIPQWPASPNSQTINGVGALLFLFRAEGSLGCT